MRGRFLFGDFGTTRLSSLVETADGAWSAKELAKLDEVAPDFAGLSSFGRDEARELYVCDYGGGRVYKIIDNALSRTHHWADFD